MDDGRATVLGRLWEALTAPEEVASVGHPKQIFRVELNMSIEADIGDTVVVNVGTAKQPSFKVGKVEGKRGDNRDFMVNVRFAHGKVKAFKFVEAPVGLVAFSGLASRQPLHDTFTQLSHVANPGRWISKAALTRYWPEELPNQERIRRELRLPSADEPADYEKVQKDDLDPSASDPYSINRSRAQHDLPEGVDASQLTRKQKQAVSSLEEMPTVSVVVSGDSPTYMNSALDQGMFRVLFQTDAGEEFALLTRDDARWDVVDTMNPYEPVLDSGSLEDALLEIASL